MGKQMKKPWTVLAIAVLGVVSCLSAAPAQAQDVRLTGPLAGAPAVMKLRLYREGRFQIKPFVGTTLQNEFSQAILTGGQLAYHFTDWLGVGVWGAYAVANIDTSLTDEVTARGQTNERNALSLPRRQNFPNQVGRMKFLVAPQVLFIPLRGKLGMFEKIFVDTDLYVAAGVAAVQVEERADIQRTATGMPNDSDAPACPDNPPGQPNVDENSCLAQSQSERKTRTTIAPTLGIGLSLYVADFLAVNLEWRAVPFAWNTSGTDESGGGRGGDFPDDVIDDDDQIFHFNHMVSLGFAFYLPTSPSITHTEAKD